MGLISQSLWVVGNLGRRRLTAMFDSGSSVSMIRDDIAASIADRVELPEPKTFEAAVGRFTARHGVFADITIRGKRLFTGLTAVPHLTEELILGVDFLERWHIRLDPHRRRVVLDPKALKLKAVGGRALVVARRRSR